MLLWTFEFTTDRFQPFLPEPSQVNQDLYGFELAAWLAQALAGQGVVTSYPHAEEWGWFLEFFSEAEQEITIGCASHGPTLGYPTQWRIFARQRRKPLKGGRNPTYHRRDLVSALRRGHRSPQAIDECILDRSISAPAHPRRPRAFSVLPDAGRSR